ncbi:MAG: hypothetical protein ABR613_02830 [Actinomycetota bacterium]
MSGAPRTTLTPDQRLRVFVSSTLDLARRAGRRHAAIQSLHHAVMFETAARPHPPRALYRASLEAVVAAARRRWGRELDSAWERGSKMGFVEGVEQGRRVIASLRDAAEIRVS